MKATGIVRKMDHLGRVVIPMELRRTMEIGEKDSIEVFVDGDRIVLRKYTPGCVITGSQDDLVNFKGKLYSREAIRQLASLL
jgi:transcriptional pleiotropic regulator of transition state genes